MGLRERGEVRDRGSRRVFRKSDRGGYKLRGEYQWGD